MHPLRSLMFVGLFCSMAAALTFLFEGTYEISEHFQFRIPSFPLHKKNSIVNENKVLSILRTADSLESLPKKDLEPAANDTLKPILNLNLQYHQASALGTLFEALKNASLSEAIHILHYGDSQIESDRITDYLRMKMQNQFGGRGPGLIGLKPLTQAIGCKIFAGDEWERHVTFLGKNKDVPHNCFGPQAILYRFTPYALHPDSSPLKSARVSWQVNTLAGKNMTGYTRMKLLYGGGKRKIWMEYYENGILSHADSLDYGSCHRIKEISVHAASTVHEIRFYGHYSPDFYGISLESEKGVYVDNIAQRGSSGTFFHLVNLDQLRHYYQAMNVKAIFLQFGGNALPSLKNTDQVKNYASYIRAQLGWLRKITPQATVIFIGPADMGIKQGTEFITHPMLEPLRDELKKAVMDAGMVYFDLYDCMGGRNSMSTWVREKMAADDYIHFSPSGARKIATLFYSALWNEYQRWNKNANKK